MAHIFLTGHFLRPDADLASLEGKLPAFRQNYLGERMEPANVQTRLWLQPIRDIHLHSDLSYEAKENGSATVVNFLLIILVLVLAIAWINSINLTTARSMKRTREVGMRKTLGATRRQLICQFVFESMLLNTGAMLLAFGFVSALLPSFNELVGKPLILSLLRIEVWIALLGLCLIVTLLAGLYPALVLSSYQPVTVLKHRMIRLGHRLWSRKRLVTFQLAATVFLLASTLVVYRQLRFMQQQELGFEVDQRFVLRAPTDVEDGFSSKLEVFGRSLLINPAIRNVSATSSITGEKINSSNNFRLVAMENSTNLRRVWSDEKLVDALDLTLIAGRRFNHELAGDSNAVMLNESAVRYLGLPDAEAILGEFITDGENQFHVVGILADYHQQPLRFEHDPIVFFFHPGPHSSLVIHLETDQSVCSDSRP